ncbi:MAG: hypothetical protein KOO66_01375 [Bacteroidales bacterium]|nr:hypothetical protein [Bacteroidales bacterium]
MNLRFAFAVNKEDQFEDIFFGDANKFLIYEIVSGELKQVNEVINDFRPELNENKSGNNMKADFLIKHLLENDIKVIVSKQFGENIRIINEYFIPVIISSESPEVAVRIINRHLHWIKDELNNFSSGYKLFTINSGILKSSVEDKH